MMLFIPKIISFVLLISIGLVHCEDVDDQLIFVHTVSKLLLRMNHVFNFYSINVCVKFKVMQTRR